MTRPMPEPPEYWWYCTPPHGEPGLWTSDMDPAEYMPFAHLQHKRLTGVECADEFWSAWRNILRYDHDDPGRGEAIQQANTWLRFATHPHALEEA